VRHFRQAAAQGDGNAMAFLGEMHANGHGLAQDNATAIKWLEKAVQKNSAAGRNNLGFMYLHGQGVKRDVARALSLFTKAAAQGLPDAQHNLGELYFTGQGTPRDYRKAMHYFSLAAQSGHVLSMNRLGYMHASALGTARSCELAAGLYKNVAERGPWAVAFTQAHDVYEEGEVDEAVIRYLMLAEMGYEVAQHNAAFLLDREQLSLFSANSTGQQHRALFYYKRSATQGHAGSRVRVGDYLYYGLGVTPDHEAAADEYRSAADANNAQAMFNLGVMHHLGDGLEQDIHLAKRFYDMALRTSVDAKLPASLALYALYVSFAKEWIELQLLPTLSRVLADAGQGEAPNVDVEDFVRAHKTAIIIGHVLAIVFLLLARQLARHRAQQRERRQLEALERARLQAEHDQATATAEADEAAQDHAEEAGQADRGHDQGAGEAADEQALGDDGLRRRRPPPQEA